MKRIISFFRSDFFLCGIPTLLYLFVALIATISLLVILFRISFGIDSI